MFHKLVTLQRYTDSDAQSMAALLVVNMQSDQSKYKEVSSNEICSRSNVAAVWKMCAKAVENAVKQ